MKVSQDEIVDRQAVLNIEVDAESLEEHLDRAYKSLVGRVTVPGFRKGKAPRRIFERAYGRDRLVEEALETMVPEVVNKAIEETEIEAGGTPRVDVIERDPAPVIKATVPLVPLVELGDYSSIRFDDKPDEVTDERVGEALDRIRDGYATWEPKDGAVEVEDMAVLEFVRATANGKEFLSSKGVEYVVFADATYPVPGFSTEVVGLKAGESKQFSIIMPDDYPDEDAAGETAEFDLAVSEVKRKVLPELDDEFAGGVGEGYETVEELKARIREDLEAEEREYFTRLTEDKAVDAVVVISKVEIPPLTVEHEVEHVLSEQQQTLSRYKMSLQDYMSGIGKTPDELIDDARETARTRLTRALVVEKFSEAESIEVTDDQLREEIDRLKQAATSPADRATYETDRARDSVRTMLRRRSALARLVEIVAPIEESSSNGRERSSGAAGKPETGSSAKSSKAKSSGTSSKRKTSSTRKPRASTAASK